jgi:hypothetical protein
LPRHFCLLGFRAVWRLIGPYEPLPLYS